MKYLLCLPLALALSGCAATPLPTLETRSQAPLSALDFGSVPAPADKPLTRDKVELGLRLWHEPRLSGNDRMSCATCHQHERGFSNGLPTAAGITGAHGTRNVPTIYAAAYQPLTFWDGRASSLEAQALGPIENPIEMNARLPEVVRKLSAHPYYPAKFQAAFGTGVTPDGIAKAIASFERALQVGDSPFDRYVAGDKEALSAEALEGRRVFATSGCASCHRGLNFTDNLFHNLGVGTDAPNPDPGRFAITRQQADWAAFKTPTLRNVAETAPYMHDGSLATLEEVVAFYNRGGTPNDNQDPRVRPLGLSTTQQRALVAFLKALSGSDNFATLSRSPGIKLPDEPWPIQVSR